MNAQAPIKYLLAASLFPADLSLEKRVDVLSKYFEPSPNSTLRISDDLIRDRGKADNNAGLLFGNITVSPPRGTCFTITTDFDESDKVICKKTTLKWRLKDLGKDTGELKWVVKTGADDFGTNLTWKSDYRIARMIPAKYKFDEASSTPKFIRSCIAEPANEREYKGRRVRLSFFDGDEWIFRFPEIDEVITVPEPEKKVVVEAADPHKKKDEHSKDEHGKNENSKEDHAKDDHKKEEPAKSGHEPAAAHGSEKPADDKHGSEKKKDPAKDAAAAKPVENVEAWTLSTRRGFQMSVTNVIPGKDYLPGGTGKCRYQYDGVVGNYNTGRIECHYSDRFLYFYTAMPCLKYIRPADAEKK